MTPTTATPLPGMGGETEPRPDQRVAFGRFVKPEMYDVFQEYDLEAVTDSEKAWMQPGRLRQALFNPSKDAELVVSGLALNPREHNIILRERSGEYFGRSATARALGDHDLDDERIATGRRSRIHAFEKVRAGMEEHREKMAHAREDVRELCKEAYSPGYAHKTPTRMKELISVAWNEFTTMLDVLHVQRQWDDEDRHRAEAALVHYLTQGSSRDRVNHWQQMLELADNYLGARILLFRDRIQVADTNLHEYPSDQEDTIE